MLKQEDIKSLFSKKQYFEVLQDTDGNPEIKDFLGFLFLENGEYQKAQEFFRMNNMPFQEGFCKILLGDKLSARKIWYSAEENSAILWGKVLLGILDQKLEAIPTFLQVRNFAEMTLYYLFKAGQVDYAIKLISAKDFLADCNIESYKYIGRVLMDNDEEELAFDYMNKAIEVIPQDYEAYFYLGELYSRWGNTQRAIDAYNQVISLNPYHTPTRKILKKIAN